MTENQFGRESVLRLTAVAKGGQTVLEDVYFRTPFKVMKPFPEGEQTKVILMTASAGLMAGDSQRLELTVKQGAKLVFTSQSYEKIHKMPEGDRAVRHTHIRVERGGFLYYDPLPVIPFADSAFVSETMVELEDETSAFLMGDVLCAGRIARGERFAYREYCSRIRVLRGGKLLLEDNTRLYPQWMPLEAFGFWEGYTHLGNMILTGPEYTGEAGEAWMKRAREILGEEEDGEDDGDRRAISGGISRLEQGGLTVRILGNRAQDLEEVIGRLAVGKN